MSRDLKLLDGMESAARRLLPKPPGIIIPGWFWQEWVVALVIASVIALAGYGLSFL